MKKSTHDLNELLRREAELEKAMRQPGGARIIEERELLEVKKKLAMHTTGPRETARTDGGVSLNRLATLTQTI
jgi:hypothetical protein